MNASAYEVLCEAIANCLTNANHYERRGIVCAWRDDSITIENPGDFRIPADEAMRPGNSDLRNEMLLKIFSFMNVGERAGSGMGAIVGGWKAGGGSKAAVPQVRWLESKRVMDTLDAMRVRCPHGLSITEIGDRKGFAMADGIGGDKARKSPVMEKELAGAIRVRTAGAGLGPEYGDPLAARN